MKIFFNAFPPNSYHYLNNKIFTQLSPLQKKVAIVALAYFTCALLGYVFYQFYYFNNPQLSRKKIDDDQEDFVLDSPKGKKFTKMDGAHKISLKIPLPTDFLQLGEEEHLNDKALLYIKTPNGKFYNIFVDLKQESDLKGLDLKQLVAKKFNKDPSEVILIFSGRLIQDDELFKYRALAEATVIHCEIKTL